MFLGTSDGSILDYSLEEEPFTITLQQVHKNVRKQLNQILILPRSRQLAILSDGVVYLGDTAAQIMNAVPIQKTKGVRSIARSRFVQQHFDTLVIGMKRAIAVYQVTAFEVIEGHTISLPSSPLDIQFISASKLIMSSQRGVYEVDITERVVHKLFGISDPLFQKTTYMISLLLKPFSR
jgi:hypothetical protein